MYAHRLPVQHLSQQRHVTHAPECQSESCNESSDDKEDDGNLWQGACVGGNAGTTKGKCGNNERARERRQLTSQARWMLSPNMARLYLVLSTRHTSRVISHMSYVTRHTSHVTRHTSHVTRHASHVTRHTSRVTRKTQEAKAEVFKNSLALSLNTMM